MLLVDDLKSVTLRERVKKAHIIRSKEFLATEDGEEVGFVSYEDWGNNEPGFIYEIFVLPSFRRKGVGKLLLAHAENYAFQMGCKFVRLKPYTLNEDFDQNLLVDWYSKEGYSFIPGDQDHMLKILSEKSKN